MTGTRRQTEEPRNQIPDNRANQGARNSANGDDVCVDHSFSNGCRDRGTSESTGQIEKRRQADRLTRRQHFRGDDGGDRIGRIVKTVDVLKENRHHDDKKE